MTKEVSLLVAAFASPVDVPLPIDIVQSWIPIGIALMTLLVLGAQLLVFYRQQKTMTRQAGIADAQRELLANQEKLRYDQAVGALHGLVHSLISFLGDNWRDDDPDVLVHTQPASEILNSLSRAPELFAPLGIDALTNLNELRLDLRYHLEAAAKFNEQIHRPDVGRFLATMKRTRGALCDTLDKLVRSLPSGGLDGEGSLDIVKQLAGKRRPSA
jgi:hypothetical protein